MNLYVNKLTKKFPKKRPLYEDFCLQLNKILSETLDQNKYQYQIYYRVKSHERLKEKVERKAKQGKVYEKLSDVEDLAGIRIVFYLDSDKKRFVKDLDKTKFNILSVKKVSKKSGYYAKHIIIKLRDKKTDFSKYRKFKNLKCEIQLTSIFNHAWSQLEHDWVYKDVYDVKRKNPYQYKAIKRAMREIFRNYVKKLTLSFEKVAKQIPG